MDILSSHSEWINWTWIDFEKKNYSHTCCIANYATFGCDCSRALFSVWDQAMVKLYEKSTEHPFFKVLTKKNNLLRLAITENLQSFHKFLVSILYRDEMISVCNLHGILTKKILENFLICPCKQTKWSLVHLISFKLWAKFENSYFKDK